MASRPATPAAAAAPKDDGTAQQKPTSGVTLKVTQVRSTIGCKANQRATMLSLGLRKIRQTVERSDTPQIRGMIHTVRHLVTVEEVGSR